MLIVPGLTRARPQVGHVTDPNPGVGGAPAVSLSWIRRRASTLHLTWTTVKNTLKNIKGFEKYLRRLKFSSRILDLCHVIDTKTISSSINNINMTDLLKILIAYSRITERGAACPWHNTMRIQNLLPVFALILASSVQADQAAEPRTLQGWK